MPKLKLSTSLKFVDEIDTEDYPDGYTLEEIRQEYETDGMIRIQEAWEEGSLDITTIVVDAVRGLDLAG